MPITLDVTRGICQETYPGTSKVALRDAEGVMLAVLHVEELWQPDRAADPRLCSTAPANTTLAPTTP